MKRYVTDTHCLLWYMTDDRRLPKAVNKIYDAAEKGRAQVLVPSIVLVEAIFLLQRQRIARSVLDQLLQLPEEPTATLYVTPLNLAVVLAVNAFGPAAIPELADRIIAATAYTLNLPLLTVDHIIIESNLVKVIE
ncbi:MAG: type II toxin-antitoxin system VapC family toxin [Caldilineaceae bacterium]|jgi:PIN domain nuclease of toxin-antitoxin system